MSMNIVFQGILTLLSITVLTGCGTGASHRREQQTVETAKTNLVTVKLAGDVNRPGLTHIQRGLSKATVFEAAGGWRGFSSFGMEPRSITVKRVTSEATNSWRIYFREMSKPKWRNFLLQDGDHVTVNILY
jgi:hypothetical protein